MYGLETVFEAPYLYYVCAAIILLAIIFILILKRQPGRPDTLKQVAPIRPDAALPSDVRLEIIQNCLRGTNALAADARFSAFNRRIGLIGALKSLATALELAPQGEAFARNLYLKGGRFTPLMRGKSWLALLSANGFEIWADLDIAMSDLIARLEQDLSAEGIDIVDIPHFGVAPANRTDFEVTQSDTARWADIDGFSKAVQRMADKVNAPIIVDVLQWGYAKPDETVVNSRLVTYNPAEWLS